MLGFHRILSKRIGGSPFSTRILDTVHPSQLCTMTDSLIQVDSNDCVLGPIPKLDSHLAGTIKDGTIHRAFSVFLFSEDSSKLLIQKRCQTKIVFPREWANTCCSHPLFDDSEMENNDGNQIGIKRAAIKRLKTELGLSGIDPLSLSFREKILYRDISPGGMFGESECDYILLGRINQETVTLSPNPDEVENVEWISPGSPGSRTKILKEYLEAQRKLGFPPTPWFDLMVREEKCLESWWERLITDGESFLSEPPNKEIRSFLSV